jgi:hypothetical protein
MAEARSRTPSVFLQNPVFKAGRSTTPLHYSSINLVADSGNDPLTYRLSSDCSTSELIWHTLVLASRIELLSMALQTTAMTTSAKPANFLWGD